MRALFLVILLAWASALAPSQIELHLVSDAEPRMQRRDSRWVPVPLHAELVRELQGMDPMIKRVLWCRELRPVGEVDAQVMRSAELGPNLLQERYGPVSPDLRACTAPGLLHLQLYPGSDVALHQPANEPNMLYVQPDHFWGMWDDAHQMNVVVEMRINETATARHVTRFNPRVPIEEVTQEETAPRHSHPWTGALLLLLAGIAVLAGVAAYRHPASSELWRFLRSRMPSATPNAYRRPPADDDDERVLEAMGLGGRGEVIRML